MEKLCWWAGALTLLLSPLASFGQELMLLAHTLRPPQLWSIDLNTGKAIFPGPVWREPVTSVHGITFAAPFSVYATVVDPSVGTQLGHIDLLTGEQRIIGNLGIVTDEGDLDFNPADGKLYGLTHFTRVGLTTTHHLFEINPLTGAATVLRQIGTPSTIQNPCGMAFAADGSFYVLDTRGTDTSYVHHLDLESGRVVRSLPISGYMGPVGGMDFHPETGLLYFVDGMNSVMGSSDRCRIMDVTTGATTILGFTKVGGFSGITFIPEPGLTGFSMAAIVMGIFPRPRRSHPGRV